MMKGPVSVFAMIFITIFFLTGVHVSAGALHKTEGMLTAVEDDGSVIIDKQGYLTDSMIRVLDSNGKKIFLEKLPLPTKVYFEYDYSSKGPVIKLIKEIPKVRPE